ncbi:MAG TPA: YihY/virulence factor BrkB family protein [Bdellovibrionales bacterium]|nr:YihY/virulence factor BrkB family protein [Bdellovibrionales bacterium]
MFRKFRQIVWQTIQQMRDSDAPILAGSLAFTTVISLVPLLAVSLSVFMAYGGLESLFQKIEPFILQNLVEASGAEISRLLRRSIQRVHSGAIGFWGILGLLVASTKLFYDMERAVQRVWRLKANRSLFGRILIYWLVMFLTPLVLAGLLGVLSSKDVNFFAHVPKKTFAAAFVFFAFVGIYKFVPACRVHWRSALTSAVVATASVALVQVFYSGIMKNILRMNKVYGSLAGVPIFLLWLLVMWWICLAGVALSAVLEERRA